MRAVSRPLILFDAIGALLAREIEAAVELHGAETRRFRRQAPHFRCRGRLREVSSARASRPPRRAAVRGRLDARCYFRSLLAFPDACADAASQAAAPQLHFAVIYATTSLFQAICRLLSQVPMLQFRPPSLLSMPADEFICAAPDGK